MYRSRTLKGTHAARLLHKPKDTVQNAAIFGTNEDVQEEGSATFRDCKSMNLPWCRTQAGLHAVQTDAESEFVAAVREKSKSLNAFSTPRPSAGFFPVSSSTACSNMNRKAHHMYKCTHTEQQVDGEGGHLSLALVGIFRAEVINIIESNRRRNLACLKLLPVDGPEKPAAGG